MDAKNERRDVVRVNKDPETGMTTITYRDSDWTIEVERGVDQILCRRDGDVVFEAEGCPHHSQCICGPEDRLLSLKAITIRLGSSCSGDCEFEAPHPAHPCGRRILRSDT